MADIAPGATTRTALFLDTEFTGLTQHARLISLALVPADGPAFYAEFTDWEQGEVDPWVRAHVIPACWWLKPAPRQYDTDQPSIGQPSSNQPSSNLPSIDRPKPNPTGTARRCPEDDLHCHVGNRADIVAALAPWLQQWPALRIHADCLAYDWVLFCELFGGARRLPANLHYIPLDLATLFHAQGLDPDTDRYAFAGLERRPERAHHALWDARALRGCWQRLSHGSSAPD